MRILLLGATGRTGQLVLKDALKKGFSVSCLARKTERIPQHERVSIFEGDPTNIADLKNAVQFCDTVISVLNISRKTDFPWSSIRTPKTFLSDTMNTIVSLSNIHKFKKIIVCSAWGVGDSRKDIPFWFRWTIDFSNIRYAYEDHERQEEILKASGLYFAIIRPVGLTDFKQVYPVKESINNHPRPNILISRKSVAAYLVACISTDSKEKRTITISNA